MSDQSGAHWYGRNHWPMANNPDQRNFKRWLSAFNRAATLLKHRGFEVVNASPASALTCFPKISVEDALAAWQ